MYYTHCGHWLIPVGTCSNLRVYPVGQVTTEHITGAGVDPGLNGGSLGIHLNCAHSFLVLFTDGLLRAGLSNVKAWFC